MSNNVVLDFVTQFMPERLPYWNRMDYIKTLKLARHELTSADCEHLMLFPEEAGLFDFCFNKMKKNITDIQFILENSEVAYDVLFWKEISNFYPKWNYSKRYDFIFQNPSQYKKELRNCKTVNGCFNKIKNLIPQRYYESQLEGKEFFGEFSVKLDTVHFESRFETLNFSHDEVYLIPYFIEYRNHHLLEWIYQEKAYSKGLREEHLKKLTSDLQKLSLNSSVQAETLITNRIRAVLHNKGYFEGIKVEWNQDQANRLILVTYVKKNSSLKAKITTTIRAFKLEDDILKLEASL